MKINHIDFVKVFIYLSVFFMFLPEAIVKTADASAARRNTFESLSYSEGRVKVRLSGKASYRVGVLDKNQAYHLPYRIYIDFQNTIIGPQVANITDISDPLLQQVRVAQTTRDTVRLVLDLSEQRSRQDCNIYYSGSNLLYIELKGLKQARSDADTPLPPKPPVQPKAVSSGAEVRQTEQRKFVVVIDPGHGGRDPGAIGYNGLMEKEVSLLIARELKKRIDRDGRFKTVMTRYGDQFVSLQERADIANSHNADLFISIHANSHHDTSLTGIETYYLNFSSDAASRRAAARENFTTPEKIGDLEMILFDLLQSSKINASSILAGHVHNSLINALSKNRTIRNLGVKHAPFRVLLDADMPGVLIEAAFISNPQEAVLLQRQSHQRLLAEAIFNGIERYLTSEQTAFYISK